MKKGIHQFSEINSVTPKMFYQPLYDLRRNDHKNPPLIRRHRKLHSTAPPLQKPNPGRLLANGIPLLTPWLALAT
jgi:hypothetical protein